MDVFKGRRLKGAPQTLQLNRGGVSTALHLGRISLQQDLDLLTLLRGPTCASPTLR